MDPSLFRYIWKHSKREQIIILMVTFCSFPLIYYSLDLPKQIVNQALQGTNWPQPVPILGIQLDQVPYLLTLCFLFLALVIINNGIKFWLNTAKNLLGERMLRRLRYDLYQRVLRFRLPRFRQVSQGEIIPMITSEVEPLGDYIGDAIALPAFQGGTLIVYLYFIFAQDLMLGAAAIALYPLQMWIIPWLQAKVNRLARERVINVRRMADRIGETISGVREIHANDTSAWHLADLSDRLYTNFDIRYRGFQLRFLIKFVNNFINQLTPFFFYSIGGYLVIKGDLSFGALVAVLAAYKDLASPWKELLAFYQARADVEIKYQTVVENFDVPDVKPLPLLIDDAEGVERLSGEIELKSVTYNGAGHPLTDVSARIPQGATVAVVGEDTDGRGDLLEVMAGLVVPNGGEVKIGGRDIETLPEAVLGRSIAYVGANPYVFSETIRGNLTYGLRHRPVLGDGWPDTSLAKRMVEEAEKTGNTWFPISARWDDLSEAKVSDVAELDERSLALLEEVGLGDDAFRLGLKARIDPKAPGAPVAELIAARKKAAERILADPQAADLVELWDADRLNPSATLAENVLFALPSDPTVGMRDLARDPLVIRFLDEAKLTDEFLQMGVEIARTMIELFAQLSGEGSLLAEFSFITPDEMPTYDVMIKRVDKQGIGKLSKGERADLIGLAFELVPARHRLEVLDEERERRIVAARPIFRRLVEAEEDAHFVPFDPELLIAPLSIEDNVLFGKTRVDRRGSHERVERIIRDVIVDMGLQGQIQRAGLDYNVGVAGSRLSPGQRQRIALVRALMKRSNVAIFDGFFSSGDDPLLQTVREETEGATLVIGMEQLEGARGFDTVLVMSNGRLAASGSYDEVAAVVRGGEAAGAG
ncbi:ABC transporter transmembrane domain-containing protein [Microbaculum marinum]|uniref:ABC transporter transmembrane domain-containing protein n=1 Tax=Microbaculum marinum TaxID=1764581 RepID=A0AAW9RXV5_9HYPH